MEAGFKSQTSIVSHPWFPGYDGRRRVSLPSVRAWSEANPIDLGAQSGSSESARFTHSDVTMTR